eukprot:GHVU01132459.1.p1 GENE.GHVU01132459.1~~GHVU01132459.1.p1  ORF type:complete len:235 (-),score=52.61 GHVU01132459.1:132-836(-)
MPGSESDEVEFVYADVEYIGHTALERTGARRAPKRAHAQNHDEVDEEDAEVEEEEDEEEEEEEDSGGMLGSRGHNDRWEDSYELELALEPQFVGEQLLSARCKFCVRWGRQPLPGTARSRKRKPSSKVKKFTQFREDNIRRHLKLQHGERWEQYEALLQECTRERSANKKRSLLVQLRKFFNRSETVAASMEHVTDDIYIDPALLDMARAIYAEVEEMSESDESDLENPLVCDR